MVALKKYDLICSSLIRTEVKMRTEKWPYIPAIGVGGGRNFLPPPNILLKGTSLRIRLRKNNLPKT